VKPSYKYLKFPFLEVSVGDSFLAAPKYSIYIFSDEEISDIRNHLDYAKKNKVSIIYVKGADRYVYPKEMEFTDLDEVNLSCFVPINEHLIICPSGYLYQVGIAEDDRLDSDIVNLEELKEVKEWDPEIEKLFHS